jgi:origin recognition complex subunit 1
MRLVSDLLTSVFQNEIYFSLSTRVAVTPSVILSRCLVSNRLKAFSKPEENIPVTPSKRKLKNQGSPLKKRTKFTASSDDSSDDSEEGEQDDVVKVPDDPDKIFYCKLAVDSRRGLFYNFNWDRHRKDALELPIVPIVPSGQAGPSLKEDDSRWADGHCWDVEVGKIGHGAEKSRKIQSEDSTCELEGDDPDEYQDGDLTVDEMDEGEVVETEYSSQDGAEPDTLSDLFRTPSKKRKRSRNSVVTPRKQNRNKTLAQPTPHSKAALVKRRKRNTTSGSPRKLKSRALFPIRYPEQSLGFQASLSHLPEDPWLRSMHALHVGSRPDTLPCREEEYARVLRCVGELLEEGSGGCICELLVISFNENVY